MLVCKRTVWCMLSRSIINHNVNLNSSFPTQYAFNQHWHLFHDASAIPIMAVNCIIWNYGYMILGQYLELFSNDINPLQWSDNGRDGVSNHQPHHCLLNRLLFRRRSRKHQSSASQAFVRGIHRWPVNSPHKGPVTRKMFPFEDVIMSHPQLMIMYVDIQTNWLQGTNLVFPNPFISFIFFVAIPDLKKPVLCITFKCNKWFSIKIRSTLDIKKITV